MAHCGSYPTAATKMAEAAVQGANSELNRNHIE